MAWSSLPQRVLSRCLSLVYGKGWMYRFPKHYDRIIRNRLDAVREEAFNYFLATYSGDLRASSTCIDLACGTGLTSVALARNVTGCRVIGVDQNAGMLEEAKKRAREMGVDRDCTFIQLDVHQLSIDALAPVLEGRDQVDVITCALGFSVIPGWEEAFQRAYTLLSHNGIFVIFDDYTPDLYLPAFDANQSRRSWELIEHQFAHTEVKWFDEMFIAIGRGKHPRTPSTSNR